MALTIGGVTHPDGAPLTVGGVQVQNVTVQSAEFPTPVEVWRNNYVADVPTGFTASDSLEDTMNFAWVLPVDQGVPTCTYEIRDSVDTVVGTAPIGATAFSIAGVRSGTYSVFAVNVAGESESNTDAGQSFPHYVGAPSPVILTTSGNYTAGIDFPARVSLTLCMVGGGAAGEMDWGNQTYGGYAGTVTTPTYTATQDEIISVAIGTGGIGTSIQHNGAPGQPTTFANLSASGAPGSGFNGHGEGVTTCGGSSSNGNQSDVNNTYQSGGQGSGFGNGGSGGWDGGNGGTGAGGGAGTTNGGGSVSGSGGRGQVNVSW